ncbi:MAG: CAP domain-containing protein [Anaerolineae bacterium]
MRRHPAVFIFIVLVVAHLFFLSAPALTATDNYEQQVVNLVNQERTSRGLSPLVIHHMLESAAEAHSRDMGDNNHFGHDSSDGTSWSTRIQQHGYTPFYGLAENVAGGYAAPEQVVTAWMNSDGHRANILGDYEHVGVGYYYNGNADYRHYWTMDFGKPAPDTPPPCTLEHDFNNNGVIGVGDIEMVAQCWRSDEPCDPTYDVTHDQVIDVVDVMTVSSEWGMTCQ